MLMFSLWDKKGKKKTRGHQTIDTFAKRIEDKTNDSNNNNSNISSNLIILLQLIIIIIIITIISIIV